MTEKEDGEQTQNSNAYTECYFYQALLLLMCSGRCLHKEGLMMKNHVIGGVIMYCIQLYD